MIISISSAAAGSTGCPTGTWITASSSGPVVTTRAESTCYSLTAVFALSKTGSIAWCGGHSERRRVTRSSPAIVTNTLALTGLSHRGGVHAEEESHLCQTQAPVRGRCPSCFGLFGQGKHSKRLHTVGRAVRCLDHCDSESCTCRS